MVAQPSRSLAARGSSEIFPECEVKIVRTYKTAFEFFFVNAGYSHFPDREGEIAGRVRNATNQAREEFLAWNAGVTFEWSEDVLDSSEWSIARPAYTQWLCTARDEAGRVVASLGCIDFGRAGEPWGNPYKRVVEAELACEALFVLARGESVA